MIDTHAHLYLDDFKEEISHIMNSCHQLGITHIFLPNIDRQSFSDMMNLAQRYNNCFPMMGLHPCSVNDNYKNQLDFVSKAFTKNTFHGVGEIGIDLYWDKTFTKEQIYCFEYQIDIAIEHNLPIVIHSRDSLDITIDIVTKKQKGSLKGVFHCFNGNQDQSKAIIDVGFLMGIGGVVTFKNAGVDKVVQQIEPIHLVLETDAPYLSPSPHRGKKNSPTFLPIIAQKIADLHHLSLQEIDDITTYNAKSLFGIQ